MLRPPPDRGAFVRVVCVLCVALVCVMGTVQATHSHPDDSATSHHTCSICATAHAGVSTPTVASAPVLATTALAIFVTKLPRSSVPPLRSLFVLRLRSDPALNPISIFKNRDFRPRDSHAIGLAPEPFIGGIMHSFHKSWLAAAMVVALMSIGAAHAQSGGGSGSINGTVLDPSGAVVANATVEIHNPVSGYDRTTTTDNKGNFSFSNVPFNPYHMTVTAAGFATSAQDVESGRRCPPASRSVFKSLVLPPRLRSKLAETWWRTIPPSTPTWTRTCSTSFPWKAHRRR